MLHANDTQRVCQAKFLTYEIIDFTPSAHAQSDVLHLKYAEKTDD